ncbi:MAG: hypothetical protein Q9220_003563 [cf. Caloplaca sp. 1 TL-2023]
MTETKMQLNDWLDDLCVRFIINLPQEEIESVERICFQVEEAQWYYEDFIRPLDPDLPSLNLRNFCLRIFQHCPILSDYSPYHHATAFEEFLAYKTRVPVRGAILLNEALDEVVLVKGWKKGANWSFPRGKINKDESDLDCAIREVYEETGYDVNAAGLVKHADHVKYIDVAIQHQHIRLYVFQGVPMDTEFEARTRKEISKIDWWKLSDLPTLKKKRNHSEGKGEDLAMNANKFYMVAPFLVPLKKWISQQKRQGKGKSMAQDQESIENLVDPMQTDHGFNDTEAVPPSGDLERLLAGLRQPLQAPSANGLQPPGNAATAQEASLQLKNLLHVQTTNPSGLEIQNSYNASGQPVPIAAQRLSHKSKDASALLALIKGGTSIQPVPVPQTPAEQVTGTPAVPGSPPHHHATLANISTQNPPPSFPIPLNGATQTNPTRSNQSDAASIRSTRTEADKASVTAWNNFLTTSTEEKNERRRVAAEKRAAQVVEEAKTGIRHEPTLPVMQETWREVKVTQDTNMLQANQRHVVSTSQRSVGGPSHVQQMQNGQTFAPAAAPNAVPQRAPAPYQATSKISAAANSQYPDVYRPTIPQANKLPIPKLNGHSSSLLSLFKSGPPPEAVASSKKDDDSQRTMATQRAGGDASRATNAEGRAFQSFRIPVSGEKGNAQTNIAPPDAQKMAEVKRPQSAHQTALLGLFHRPSIPAKDSTSPSGTALDVPKDIVELSALPSPRRSQKPSEVDSKAVQKSPSLTSGKTVTVQKHRRVHSRPGESPVSATISGPLNVPQFDVVARRARESKQKPTALKEAKVPPVTILARPASLRVPPKQPEPTLPDGQEPKSPSLPPSPNRSTKGSKSPSSRPFQPQILRRPAPTSPPEKRDPILSHPDQMPNLASTQKRETPSPLSASDHRLLTSKPDHKATLLSLFTKTASPLNTTPALSSGPDLSAFVSPVAVKPPASFPLPPRKLGSISIREQSPDRKSPNDGSAIATRVIANPASGRLSPKKMTSDTDRTFLLGYLDNVARREGK